MEADTTVYMAFTPEQSKEYGRLSSEYRHRFEGKFPAYVTRDAEAVIGELRRCLETGEPNKVKERAAEAQY